MARPLLLLLCALLLVTVAGCGGDDGDDDDRGGGIQTLAKPEYVRQFNAIVDQAQRDESPAKASDDKERLDLALKIFERMADRLAALVPPPEARTAHADFVAGIKTVFGLQRRVFDTESSGDRAAAQRIARDTATPRAAQRRIESARRFFDAKGYAIDVSPVAATTAPAP